ncbi:MAG: hypothetical protein ABIB43_05350 [archaeon]
MNYSLRFGIDKIALFVLVVLILSLPLFMRLANDDSLFVGGESFYDFRASEDLANKHYWDGMTDRLHQASFFYYLLAFLTLFMAKELFVGLSIILGIISAWLFYKILKRLIFQRETVIISTFLFIVSPGFIYLFSSFSIFSLATVLSLLSLFFYIKKNYWSLPFLMLISITNFAFFICTLFLMTCFYFYDRDRKFFLTNMIISIISFLSFYFLHPGFLVFKNLFFKASFMSLFTSFGSKIGIAFFYLFLGVTGFFVGWQRKKHHVYILISFMVLLLFSFFNPVGRIFSNLYLSVFSATLIYFLIKREWEISIIKRFTLLLIFCGVIFSTSLYIDQTIHSEPQRELIESLEFLLPYEDGIVLSHDKYGFFIEFYANKRTFIDEKSINYDNYNFLRDIQQNIFYSRNLELTESLLKENNIKYLLITPEMRTGLVWKREGEGLLFLLEKSDSFIRLTSDTEFEVWKFVN